jgi:hypothetical protein
MAIFKTLLLVVLGCAFYVGSAQDIDTVKTWSSNNKLKWSDFKGCPSAKEPEPEIRAICPHEIVVSPIREKGILNYQVEVIFLKNQAWTKDTSSYVLAHEQLHFDIAELYARRLRKSISEIVRRSASLNDYQVVIEELLVKESEAQGEYDRETAHGIYEKRQFEWLEKIMQELESLKEYASD